MSVSSNQTSSSFILDYSSLWELRDRRVEDWPMMSSVWPTVSLSAFYLYVVLVLGPRLMKDRQPYDLKWLIQTYNILSVAGSAYVVYEATMAGWGTHYNWVCQDVERSSDPNGTGMRMARVMWVYYISKFCEFFDTIAFIARKKFRNVNTLQVFHHAVMPLFTFSIVRWLPGGHETFMPLFNSVVHVIMYSYYFMAALGPQFQKYLWWKKYLTTFQMVQFCMTIVKSSVVILGLSKCGYPWQFSVVTTVLMVIFWRLFYNFYQQEYKSSQRIKEQQAKKAH